MKTTISAVESDVDHSMMMELFVFGFGFYDVAGDEGVT
jgi:hypothetical protein